MERKKYMRSKIMVPQIFHEILPRRSIAAVIDGTALDEAVCFVAPYGYGKTLSVASWLRESGGDAAWLTLDSADNSESAFLAGLSAALKRFAGWQGDANDILSDYKYLIDPQEFLWEAVSAAEESGRDNILVIDNFRFIRNHALLRIIKDILSRLLGHWRVIIMSRAELPAAFSELVLKGHVCLITLKELGFSPEEMAEFFDMNGCDALSQDVLQIRDETEGWPAALNVILTISRGASVAYGETAYSYIMSFFETEVWDGLEENIRNFLLKTSILDKLTPEVCRVVTDIEESESILQRLFSNGLFVFRLDERNAYFYHRAFQAFLRDKLSASDIDERELYRKLGWWMFENNEIEQSFTCFFEAGDLYGVNQALRIINPSNMGMERFVELASCLTTLDDVDLKLYPSILAKKALSHYLIGDIARMQEIYHMLLDWQDTGALPISPEEYSEYMWELGWLCNLDPDEPTRDNKKHRDWSNYGNYVPHLKELHLDRIAVFAFPSAFRGVRDYGDDGLFDTEAILKKLEQGDTEFLTEEESVWYTYLIRAEHLYEMEKFVEAEKIVRHIMSLVEAHHYVDRYFMCTALLVKLIRATRDTREIGALTDRLETIIMNNESFFLLPNLHAFQMRNRLADGQAGFTELFEKENKEYEDKTYFFLIYRHFTFVRGLLSTGEYSRAMLILGNLELLGQNYNRPTDLLEVNILKAAALYKQGYEEEACRHLEKALDAAERYGYIRIFSDDAEKIWPVLELVRKQKRGKYIQNVFISCKKMLARFGHQLLVKEYPHIGLTKTEREILKTMQSGMSYAEIADDKGVSVSTIQSHVRSIYSKLEVNNRMSAVVEAQNRGILE